MNDPKKLERLWVSGTANQSAKFQSFQIFGTIWNGWNDFQKNRDGVVTYYRSNLERWPQQMLPLNLRGEAIFDRSVPVLFLGGTLERNDPRQEGCGTWDWRSPAAVPQSRKGRD